MNKNLLFEYIVFRLDEWRTSLNVVNVPTFTKLRLQKILFLICAWNATDTDLRLLNVFNHFYALPYGPVEIDIYEAMNNNSFQHINFCGNECIYEKLELSLFVGIPVEKREWVDEAIGHFKNNQCQYLTMPIFDLVEITHKWSAWKISMKIANMFGTRKEEMSIKDICVSNVKAF